MSEILLSLPSADDNIPAPLRSFDPELVGRVAGYARKGIEGAANTRRAYAADLAHYETWCRARGLVALPATAEVLSAYLTDLADEGGKWATLTRRLAALTKWHRLNGLPGPAADERVRAVLEGIKRTVGVRQRQAPAWTLTRLKVWVRELPTRTAADRRNKALLLLGFTGAFRRSELVALDVENLVFTDGGLTILYYNSKTNQYGEQEEKAIFYSPDPALCPIRAVEAWLPELGRSAGPLFVRVRKGDRVTAERLTDQVVGGLVKRHFGVNYSAHSLRASFVTIAKTNGADDAEVMRQTKHKTSVMIQRYTRLETIRQHNAAMKLGL